MATATSSTRKSIRHHRKSRAGCSLCKRRKVKCNEEKPCSNCVSFGLPCDLVPDSGRVDHGPVSLPRRGRGRPRKIWTATDTATAKSPVPRTTSPGRPLALHADSAQINLDNAELLIHFIATTTETLAGGDNPDIHQFWRHNVPRIGLEHTFVLHLVFALAAFHLAYLAEKEGGDAVREGIKGNSGLLPVRRSRSDYLALAQQHFTVGLSGFSTQLSQPGPGNCGALYLGATLTSYCTFAAGPTSPHDLLVCTAHQGARDDTQDSMVCSPSSMPFVHGVRLMHQSFAPDVLFAGLMEPLRAGPAAGLLEQPVYARDGFPRLEWEDAVDGLRKFIAGAVPENSGQKGAARTLRTSLETGRDSQTAAASFKALDSLIGIYEATYGRRTGPDGDVTYHGPHENQFIFGWLYRVESDFVACVRRREPHALLVLAHFAVLLNREAIRTGWYIEGWRDHIIAEVDDLLQGQECRHWIRWPMGQVVQNGERSTR